MPTPAIVKGEFIKMITKPCKQENPIGFGKDKPIGFDGFAASGNEQTLSCVGFGNSAPSFPSSILQQTGINQSNESSGISKATTASVELTCSAAKQDGEIAQAGRVATDGDYTRQRDDDEQSEHWSESMGDFIKPAIKCR